MKVRLGYVALSKALDDVTTSSTITYTNYINKNYNASKLLEITKGNLEALNEIENGRIIANSTIKVGHYSNTLTDKTIVINGSEKGKTY